MKVTFKPICITLHTPTQVGHHIHVTLIIYDQYGGDLSMTYI